MEFGIDIRNIKRHEMVIIAMAAVVIVFIIVFWLFVYSPAKKKMRELNTELTALESGIKEIEAIAGGSKNLDEAYANFYRKYTALDARIPKEEKTILGVLPTEAEKMNIEVSSIKPDKIRESGLPVKVDGRDIKAMPISMNMMCDYITLGEYITVLRENLPVLISVELINMNGPPDEMGRLKISLNLILYLLVG